MHGEWVKGMQEVDRRMLTVVVPRVLNVGLEALDGAHSGDGSLGHEAQEGKHGKAPVLELLDLLLVGAHAHGVEGEAAEEAGLAGLLEALDTLGLKDRHDGNLDGNEGGGGESVLLHVNKSTGTVRKVCCSQLHALLRVTKNATSTFRIMHPNRNIHNALRTLAPASHQLPRPKASVKRMPATAAMAQRPFISSASR